MRKILLVEDEKMIRYGIYVMIENSGIPYSKPFCVWKRKAMILY